MFNDKKEYAALILRVFLGIVFVVHGYMKLFGGIQKTSLFFKTLGIPLANYTAVFVSLLEFFGGILLILGLFTKILGILFSLQMLVALFLVHLKNGFLVSNGGFEFVFVLFAMSASLILLGSGKYNLENRIFRKSIF